MLLKVFDSLNEMQQAQVNPDQNDNKTSQQSNVESNERYIKERRLIEFTSDYGVILKGM